MKGGGEWGCTLVHSDDNATTSRITAAEED